MRSPLRWLLTALAAATLAAGAAPSALADLKIVATVPDLAAIAKAIGGDDVSVTALAKPTQDAHFVDARPSLMLPLHRADMLLVNGLDLEVGWLPPLQQNARNARIQLGADGYFDASTQVERLGAQVADRAKGDVHPGGNPHFLHDPRAAARVAHALAARMAKLDPERAEAYQAREERFIEALEAFAEREEERFAALPPDKRQIVGYHASLIYLIDWLGLEEIATVEPKPGISPTPGHVAKVLQLMKQTGARAILQEQYYPKKTSETLAKLTDGELVIIPGGTRFEEGETYLERLARTTEALHAALSQ